MTHTNLYTQLGNRTSPAVRDALTRKCEICGATAGDDCTNKPINNEPRGDIVHIVRVRG